MRMRKDGEITIPPAIREQLGLCEGSDLDVEVEGGCIKLRLAEVTEEERTGPGWELVRHLAGRGSVPWTTDELMALTRGED